MSSPRFAPAQAAALIRAVFGAFLVNGVMIGVWGGSLPGLRERVGTDATGIGLALVATGLAAIFSMQIGGRVSDRLTPRLPTLVGGFVMVAAVVLGAFAPNLPTLLVAGVLLGLGNGTMDVSMNALGIDAEQAGGRPVMSRFHAWFSLGGLVGSGLILLLGRLGGGDAVDPRMALLTTAVCAVLSLGVLWVYTPRAEVRESVADGGVVDRGAVDRSDYGASEPARSGGASVVVGQHGADAGDTSGTSEQAPGGARVRVGRDGAVASSTPGASEQARSGGTSAVVGRDGADLADVSKIRGNAHPSPAVTPGIERGGGDSVHADTPRAEAGIPAQAWLLGVMALFFGFTEGTAVDWASIHVTDVAGVSASTGAAGLVSVSTTMVLIRLVGDRLVERFGRVAVVRFGAPVAVLGYAITVVADALPLILVGWLLVGLGVGMIAPQIYGIAGHMGGGRVLALVTGCGYTAFLTGPAIIGFVSARWGIQHTMLLPLTAGVLLTALTFTTALREPEAG